MFKLVAVISVIANGAPLGQFMPVMEWSTMQECRNAIPAIEAAINKAIAPGGIKASGGVCVRIGERIA